jgi:hypothetical protein
MDRGRRWSTVDHGHRLGGGSLENGRNSAPVRGTSPWLRKKGGGDSGEPHRLQEGVVEGQTQPGDSGEQSAEEVLGGVDVADSRASK